MLVGLVLGEELAQGLVTQVLGLVDLAGVHVQLEEVVDAVTRQVVVIVGEDILLGHIGADVVQLHPEHGIGHGLAGEVVDLHHHGA